MKSLACCLAFFTSLITISAIYSAGLGPFPSAPPHTVQPRVKSTANKFTPTNSWFENLLLGKGDNPIQTYPYQIRARQTGLSISYAGKLLNTKLYILEVNLDNIVLSIRETFPEPLIDVGTVNSDYFDLGVKINFGSQFDVVVVRGSASVVAHYRSVKPVMKTIHAILNEPAFPQQTKTLKVSFNNGQTWLIQSQSPILWGFSGSEFSAQIEYTGWIKVSIVTSTQAETALTTYADSTPITNAKVTYSVDRSSSPGEVTVDLEYNTGGLFYMLPHAYLYGQNGASLISGASATGVKGTYKLGSGKGYKYKVPIYTPSDKSKAVDSQEKRDKLSAALKADVASLKLSVRDPYFGGKELARAANLIEIADLLGDTGSKTKVKDLLTKEFDDFWFGMYNGTAALVYEPTWGGIVTKINC